MKESVKVVIPVYKECLSDTERVALTQCLKILKSYPLTIIKPKSLDVTALLKPYGTSFGIESFDDVFFDGIEGYNNLMLSSQFYERFLDVKYILIYQLDAFVFRDELTEWCSHDYDYIGAPWLCKAKYRNFLMKSFLSLRGLYYSLAGIKHRQQCFYKVGNGGFSLRKVEACYRKTLEMKETVDYYLSNLGKGSQFNEDVFWALEAPRGGDFVIPDWKKALRFSFDLFPELAYDYSEKRLPFGCHQWNKQFTFWQKFINNKIN